MLWTDAAVAEPELAVPVVPAELTPVELPAVPGVASVELPAVPGVASVEHGWCCWRRVWRSC